MLIAELGSSGDTFALRERIFDGSHDDLSLSDYAIDREPDSVCIFTNHQHVKLLTTLVIHLKDSRETKQRQNFAAIGYDLIILQHSVAADSTSSTSLTADCGTAKR